MKRGGPHRESIRDKICTIESNKLLNILASDATACCSKCGARANDPASLCSPVKLSGSG